MSKYSKINFVYFMQKWMDSVPGQTFLNYAYSWGAAVVILGTLFKLTHLPGANLMLFLGMGTEVFVFFISAFDRPFDKTTIDMTLANHMGEEVADKAVEASEATPVVKSGVTPVVVSETASVATPVSTPASAPVGTIILGDVHTGSVHTAAHTATPEAETFVPTEMTEAVVPSAPQIGAPAPAVSTATAEAMETATVAYVERLEQLNETLKKVEELSSRLATDSEEMENLNRTLTGIARVYEMQLKSASQQITTQDSINEQTNIMAEKIHELNAIYARMIEAMTVNMPKGA